jgi:hypothetical protein
VPVIRPILCARSEIAKIASTAAEINERLTMIL